MEKELITLTMDRLSTLVPAIRWIDLEDGQLIIAERPPLAYPACLIDLSYPSTRTAPDSRRQSVMAEIRLTFVFQAPGATSAVAPGSVRARSFERYDIMNAVHSALQGWDAGGLFSTPMSRTRVAPRGTRGDGLKVYDASYQLGYMDAPDVQTKEG